jgi:hypothetical protein
MGGPNLDQAVAGGGGAKGGDAIFSINQFLDAVQAQWTKVQQEQNKMTVDAQKSGGGLNITAMMRLQQDMNILEMAANLGSTMLSSANGMIQTIMRNMSK